MMTLRNRRADAGLSQTELGRRVGKDRQTIHAYEQRRHVPPLDVAARMATALGCSLDDLEAHFRGDDAA